MTSLASCWLMVEAFVIPNGFLKWLFLSFYIHPFFLFFSQVFLWLNYFSFLFLFPLKIISFACSYVFNFLKNSVIYVFSSTRLTNHSDQIHSFPLVQTYTNTNHDVSSNTYLSLVPISYKLEKYKNYEEQVYQNDQVLYEDDSTSIYGSESSNQYVQSPSSSSWLSDCSTDLAVANDIPDVDEASSLILISSNPAPVNEEITGCEYSAYVRSYNSLAMVGSEGVNGYCDEDQDFDEFYDKYTERMGWFDVLNCDRTYGISAILSSEVNESPVSSVGSVLSIPRSESDKKMIIRSRKRDMEIVYVAQSCLSWEALHHQYLKVGALAESSRGNGVFYSNVAAEFQKFQVLLERFMEDERCLLGLRVDNYVATRFHLRSLLQVPHVSGFREEGIEEMKNEGTSVREVVKAIEKCIEAFWAFVKIDEKKKTWWKLRGSSPMAMAVEDPRDFYLFLRLTNLLKKKQVWQKDTEGKQKYWMKRRKEKQVEEWERKEMLFTKIEMKLASRLLQIPLLSSSQLQWCLHKLESIHFLHGKIVRSSSSSSPLFPP